MNQVGSCVVQLRLVASLLVTYRLLVCVLRWMETAKERSSGALAGSTYFGVQYQCAPIQHPPVYVHRERETATGVGTVRPPLLLHRDMRYNCMHGCIYLVESWSSPPSHHFNKLCMSSCCFFRQVVDDTPLCSQVTPNFFLWKVTPESLIKSSMKEPNI
jgi:hypothetical protein